MLRLAASAPVHQRGNSPMLGTPTRIPQYNTPNSTLLDLSHPSIVALPLACIPLEYVRVPIQNCCVLIEPLAWLLHFSHILHSEYILYHSHVIVKKQNTHNLCFMDIIFTLKNAFFQRTLLSAYFRPVTTITIFLSQFIS